ncbi:MAG TPA: uroporphyrinogen decarboxylase family protein [Planctomycetota bacterium]|nr:uroporphyrinogen decarboxylase family protein [Planctomycetota bacterium]
MPKEIMTPRERWQAVLKRQKPDRVPMDYWATEEVNEKLKKFLGCSDMLEVFKKLHIDRPVVVRPRYIGPAVSDGSDIFGCRYRIVDYGTGKYEECIHNPLAKYETLEELQKDYRWPSADWYDYSGIAGQLKGKEEYPVQGGGSEPFMAYKELRGQELALMDLIANPEIVHYCLDKLFDLAYTNTQRIYEQILGRVTYSYIAEDMGSQDDLMFSPAQIREFLIPRMKRMIDLAHRNGAAAFHHNDGSIRKIIPDMIQTGIDILNPIQWPCKGMEREGLKRDFGSQVIFHGAVDNQRILPFGTKDEVRQEVLDNLRILGQFGGYILAPCHNIQSVTPPENIVAMYETGYENGWV